MRCFPAARRSLRVWLVPALLFAGTVLLCSAIMTIVKNILLSRRESTAPPQPRSLDDYTFIGDDYPPYYPISLADVSLTPENTIHYQIFSSDAETEWSSIFPPGGGFLSLGPSGRLFGLTLFHQMHCLTRIRRAMSTPGRPPSNVNSEHVQHCLSYLRQTIMCEANPTIEPVIPILGRRSVNAEIPRTCRDWTSVFGMVEDNYRAVLGREGRSDSGEGLPEYW